MDDYEVGLHKTIVFCDLVISNEGRQGITKENTINAKELKADYEKYLAGYKS